MIYLVVVFGGVVWCGKLYIHTSNRRLKLEDYPVDRLWRSSILYGKQLWITREVSFQQDFSTEKLLIHPFLTSYPQSFPQFVLYLRSVDVSRRNSCPIDY